MRTVVRSSYASGRSRKSGCAQVATNTGALTAVAGGHAAAADGGTTCEIKATPGDGMLAVEGVVHATSALSGSYQKQVASQGPGGSSNINQGGDFDVASGQTVTLGQVMLGSDGAAYNITLKLDANGHTVQCKGHFGSATVRTARRLPRAP